MKLGDNVKRRMVSADPATNRPGATLARLKLGFIRDQIDAFHHSA